MAKYRIIKRYDFGGVRYSPQHKVWWWWEDFSAGPFGTALYKSIEEACEALERYISSLKPREIVKEITEQPLEENKMVSILEIEVHKGQPLSDDSAKLTNYVSVVLGEGYWQASIESWRDLVANIESKIRDLN